MALSKVRNFTTAARSKVSENTSSTPHARVVHNEPFLEIYRFIASAKQLGIPTLSLRRADKSASISLDKQKNKKSDIQTTRPGLAQRSTRFFPASYIQLKPLRRVNSCVLLRQLIHPHRKFLNDLHSLPPSRSS